MRDLKHLHRAMALGSQARGFMPEDFRPRTLLGAVSFELGEHDIGQKWYAEAINLGASGLSVDADLKRIVRRADPARRDEIKKALLSHDRDRYQWVHKNYD